MLTEEKLDIYIRYNGDIDNWARGVKKKEKLIMSDNDWYVIAGLIQDLSIIKKGLASEGFENSVNCKLRENLNDQGIEKIKRLIGMDESL
jgi:hypothetical protein